MEDSDFIRFKNESFRLKLKRYALNNSFHGQTFILFGGTGAVGGQAAIELIQVFEFMHSIQPEPTSNTLLNLVITSVHENEVKSFITKLYKAFDRGSNRHGFEKSSSSDENIVKILTRKSGVIIEFHILRANPNFHVDNALIETEDDKSKIEQKLLIEIDKMASPFSTFIDTYKQRKGYPEDFKFKGVICGIPIPSVATYQFGQVDKLKLDKEKKLKIKSNILNKLAQDFGQIKQKYADEVLMAHTTGIGGMYNFINGKPVIRLGFAHSAKGELLKEKQFFANELTKYYSGYRLKVLVTAAAIGINYIDVKKELRISGEIFKKFEKTAKDGILPFPEKLIERTKSQQRPFNRVFPSMKIAGFNPLVNEKGDQEPVQKIKFADEKGNPPQPIKVDFALSSGENGAFSIDNAMALYLTMKVASQEELAHVLVSNALFGDDKQKPWFDDNGICYHTETDNSSHVFAILNSRAEFRAYQTSAFTVKAFQDLGSAKHQGELHTIGLYMLLHRLKSLDKKSISNLKSKYLEKEVMEFVDKNTPQLLIRNITSYDPEKLTLDFTNLLTLENGRDVANLIGFKSQLQSVFITTFFQHLYNAIKNTINTITSLGTPIVFQDKNGKDQILAGPYLAPIDIVVSHNNSLAEFIDAESKKHDLNNQALYEWLIASQGFVDLRPKATVVTCNDYKKGLKGEIAFADTVDDFRHIIEEQQKRNKYHQTEDQYFTCSGIIAFIGKFQGLRNQLKRFDLSLGTFNTWKALFPVDSNNNHPVIPGIVEGMRMYFEGLGKITGTEIMYPKYGYFN